MSRNPVPWVFLGGGTMGAAALDRLLNAARPILVVTTPPDPYGNPVLDLVDQHELPAFHTTDLNADTALHERIAGFRTELGVACVWNDRLQPPALELPRNGWLNLHPSRLPQWRGGNPISWQMLATPGRMHCSVHWMTAEIDAGPVVASDAVELASEDDFDDASRRCGTMLGALAAGVLAEVATGSVPRGAPQVSEEATLCPPGGVLPFARPARMTTRQLLRLLRAFGPTPGVVLEGVDPAERLIGGELAPPPGAFATTEEMPATPGLVREFDDGEVLVACSNGWVRTRKRPPVITT